MGSNETVIVREVGPRDGLQSVKEIMPTESKLRWIAAMHAAGVRDMEVTSFVPAATLPQLADSADIVCHVRTEHPGLRALVLVPNLRGAQDAVGAGAERILVPVSASEAHSRSNVRRSIADQVRTVASIVSWARALEKPPLIEGGIATAFGCSLQGEVAQSDVVHLAVSLMEAGVDRIALADTLGYATPSQVKRLVSAVRSAVGEQQFGNLHLHDTLGSALANVYAGLEVGVRGFDSAARGLGGCPFAPGSVGNVATEDLVYLLESEGMDTGIDLAALVAASDSLQSELPGAKLHSRVAAAGVPRTFTAARLAAHQ